VAKVKDDGSGLDYCGYIGGDGNDQGNGIAVDGSGCAYVTGQTASDETTFPVTVGPDLTYNSGGDDAFVAKVCYTVPVGGIIEPVDLLQILAPWLGLAAFIVVAMAAIVLFQRRRVA
jgi:hypothetical protein